MTIENPIAKKEKSDGLTKPKTFHLEMIYGVPEGLPNHVHFSFALIRKKKIAQFSGCFKADDLKDMSIEQFMEMSIGPIGVEKLQAIFGEQIMDFLTQKGLFEDIYNCIQSKTKDILKQEQPRMS